MLVDLTEPQRELAEYMSLISERAYAASWMHGIEIELWSAIQSGPVRCGLLQLDDGHIARLKMLSERCNGWIYFDDQNEESFAAIPEWQLRLAKKAVGGRQNAP